MRVTKPHQVNTPGNAHVNGEKNYIYITGLTHPVNDILFSREGDFMT
jgi:hypothetical protein